MAGRIQRLLDGLVASGLRHASRPVLADLRTLEKSAHAAGLVHLEREVAVLATELGRYLARDPTFRAAGYAAAATRCHLRCTAARTVLAREPSDDDALLLGVHRRKYAELAGRLAVSVRGATGYVTDSGFTGITIHLQSARGPLQAALVRPSDWFGDDPKRLLFQPISEVVPLTIHELAHGAWWLDDVRASADGRLSLHAGLQATPAPPVGLAGFADVACETFADGVRRLVERELDPLAGDAGTHVLLQGLRVGEVLVDETRALARVVFTDRAGGHASLQVPLLPRHDLLLDNLSRLRQTAPAALFGRLSAHRGVLRFDPWTAWFDTPVKLAFRRSGAVQEVHLGLEPLTGAVDRRPGPLPPEAEAAPDPIARAVSDAQALLAERFAAGTALPSELGPELAVAADRLRELGLAEAGDAVAGAGSAPGTLQDAAARLHLVAQGWGLLRLAEAPTARAAPIGRRGADRTVLPLGVVRSGERVEIVAVDVRDGARTLLLDTWTRSAEGVASRLFQALITPADVLARAIVLTDHPTVRTRDGQVFQPAWHTAARSGEPAALSAVPLLAAPGTGPFRMALRAEPGPDGWRLLDPDGAPVDAVVDEATELELDKRSVGGLPVAFEGLLVNHRGPLTLLRVDGRCPAADPGITRWSRARLEPLWPRGEPEDALVVAEARALGGEAGRKHVREAVAAVRAALAQDGALPPAAVLWSWGRYLDPATDAPIAALGLPEHAVRRAIVRPLARWLRGIDDPDAPDAARLLVGAGEVPFHVDLG